MSNISDTEIEEFFSGRDPEEYIVKVEADNYKDTVTVIYNHPERGKFKKERPFTAFLWVKEGIFSDLYGGNGNTIRAKMRENGIKIKKLETKNEYGFEPKRLENGFTYLVSRQGSFNKLSYFFKDGGVNIYSNKSVFRLSPEEQYLIQTSKRLFKGYDDYDDIHRFTFDIETEGLDPSRHRIFQIGFRDNRGTEGVLEIKEEDNKALMRDKEVEAIATFFNIIDTLKPDVITGYNSENFDFNFFEKRLDRLGYDITKIAKTLDDTKKIIRDDRASIKVGGETEKYTKTIMYGYDITDTIHSVKRAQAINSNIKSAGLKYITQYSKIAKDNRVYVDGDKIYSTWVDDVNSYGFNEKNGEWYKITEDNPIKEGFNEVKGDYIVKRYLLDDLWETEKVDEIFGQANYLISKLLPVSFSRVTTMGTAATWKLILAAWSFEKGLAIPDFERKRSFPGGLSRLTLVGFVANVVKLDFAALYPNIDITHDIFPDLDISGVMKGLLTFIAKTRDKYKDLKNEHGKEASSLLEKLDLFKAKLADKINELEDLKTECDVNLKTLREELKGETDEEKISSLKEEIKKNKDLKSLYDKKQLPLKILANSFFGSFGAPYIFPWGDTKCAAETTIRGRQYLRLMIKYFYDKHNFKPIVGDTDGFNFQMPDKINYTYTSNGKHRFNEEGKTYHGLDAVVAEYNDVYMVGRMGLDVDEIAEATINFSKKNYADLIDGEVKLVGNSVKSKTMPLYIENFFAEVILLLLQGNGPKTLEVYYDLVDDIYNRRVPIKQIASKSKVKMYRSEYAERAKKKNKNGGSLPTITYMELTKDEPIERDLGDVVYYYNFGKTKNDTDIKKKTLAKRDENGKTIKGPDGKSIKETTRTFNCKLLDNNDIENNPSMLVDDYNVELALDKLNNKMKTLLVCFKPDIRDRIIITNPSDRQYFTKHEAELCSGYPHEKKQDDYMRDLMMFEDKEIKWWLYLDKEPNNCDMRLWNHVKGDFIKRRLYSDLEGQNTLIKELEILFEMREGILKKYEEADTKKKKDRIINQIKSLLEGNVSDTFKEIIELEPLDDGDFMIGSLYWMQPMLKVTQFLNRDISFEDIKDSKRKQFHISGIEDLKKHTTYNDYNEIPNLGEYYGVDIDIIPKWEDYEDETEDSINLEKVIDETIKDLNDNKEIRWFF